MKDDEKGAVSDMVEVGDDVENVKDIVVEYDAEQDVCLAVELGVQEIADVEREVVVVERAQNDE